MSASDYDSPMSVAAGGSGQGRVKGVSVVKPIVFGNVSRHFGKKRESDGHTHEWTVYVKPFHNEDMSAYVRKVQFKLHESYANPNRIVVHRIPLLHSLPTFCDFPDRMFFCGNGNVIFRPKFGLI